MKIPKFLFWKLYELEFGKVPIIVDDIVTFINLIGIEDYIDTSRNFYELKFIDERKWTIFKIKHGITYSDSEFEDYLE